MNTITIENNQLNTRTLSPTKIVCIGRNFVEHIEELGNEVAEEMVIFNKPNSAISSQLIAFDQEAIHYESELCFVVESGQFIAVGIGLDLTKRAMQSKLKAKGLPWERAKAFNGSAVFSPFVRLTENCDDYVFELFIDGQLIQYGTSEKMIYKPSDILAEIQTFMSFEDGDIVMTGTPKGVGVVAVNSTFEARVLLNDTVVVSKKWQAK